MNAPSEAGASASCQNNLGIHPHRTALLVQDIQQDMIMEGKAFADSGSPAHVHQQNAIENSRRLAEACRRRGVLVVHVWFICESGHPALMQNAPLFQGVKNANAGRCAARRVRLQSQG